MTAQTKYLLFKGLNKKEEILFKSYLNLAKNDLDYQVVVLKQDTDAAVSEPHIVLADESVEFDTEKLSSGANSEQVTKITIGQDPQAEASDYLVRPVQWSDFKQALIALNTQKESSTERVLPVPPEGNEQGGYVIERATDTAEHPSQTVNYEFELESLTVEYDSLDYSDYEKVVDDVKQYQQQGEAALKKPVILVTDEESSSVNSVLVIETDSLDSWDENELEEEYKQIESSGFSEREDESEDELEEGSEVILNQRAGIPVDRRDAFWQESIELIANNKTFLFIKSESRLVCSSLKPGKWAKLIQRSELSKAELQDDWQPSESLFAYPLDYLLWTLSLVNETSETDVEFDEHTKLQLESWPSFSLLELDNVLLKLCTMLFVQPESVSSLAAKSGYGRSTIRGLMSACHQQGLLKVPDQIAGEQVFITQSAEEGMLGKIKQVFHQ